MRAGPGDTGGNTILEAFKPGTAPPDNYSVIGVADADGRPLTVSPDADGNIMRPGTGGLYSAPSNGAARVKPIALCGRRRYIPDSIVSLHCPGGPGRRSEKPCAPKSSG